MLADDSRRYGPGELALAEELARRAALAIDNARLYAEAQAAEARYRGVFEGVADAILALDAEGRFRDVNAAAIELLGYQRDELLGSRLADLDRTRSGWRQRSRSSGAPRTESGGVSWSSGARMARS